MNSITVKFSLLDADSDFCGFLIIHNLCFSVSCGSNRCQHQGALGVACHWQSPREDNLVAYELYLAGKSHSLRKLFEKLTKNIKFVRRPPRGEAGAICHFGLCILHLWALSALANGICWVGCVGCAEQPRTLHCRAPPRAGASRLQLCPRVLGMRP